LKFSKLAKGLLASNGGVMTKEASLNAALKTNATEQTKVTDRATLFETRLNKQYSALDAQMASLSALNAYVSQQVTTWNKSSA
jgi:flagellar hook-associated protein 2